MQLYRFCLSVFFVSVPLTADAASELPLRVGDYANGDCRGGLSDPADWIAIYRLDSGPKKGQQMIHPNGVDNQLGYCEVGKINQSGNRYTGTAKCRSGAQIDYSTGVYKINFNITDEQSFTSRGIRYRWCIRKYM